MGSLLGGLSAKNNYQASQPLGWNQEEQNLNQAGQIYGGQQNLAQALQAQMAGNGPNPAQTQFMANQQANIANSQGLIASQRGLNPALAARLGSNAATQGNQQASMGSALLQQQQQLAATQQLGGLYGQMQQGNLGAQGLYTQGVENANGINAGVAAQNTQASNQLAGSLIGAAGAVGAGLATGGTSTLAGAAASGAGAGASGIPSASSLNMPQMSYRSQGGRIDGEAQVPGDSLKNDTVDAKLSPGEIVIPRTMAHDPEKAKEFIDHLLENEKKKDGTYGEVLKARRKRKAA